MKHALGLVAAMAVLTLVRCGIGEQERIIPATAAASTSQPVAPVRPVTDTYFGIPVVDRYRYMENLDDPEVQSWMKGQADYTRGVLDRIPGRAGMLKEIKKYVDAPPATVFDLRRMAGGRYFFMKTLADQSIAKLYMRQGVGGEDALLVDTDKFTGPHGEPPAINYFQPSDDGHYAAFGVSQGGSEMATLYVIDVETRKQLPDAIDRAEFGGVAWRADNRSFFYNRLKKLDPQESPLDKYRDSKVYLHVLGQPVEQDRVVFGRGVVPSIAMDPDDEPFVSTQPGSSYAIGSIQHGVKLEQTLYVAPIASLGNAPAEGSPPPAPWVKLCDVDAGVTDFTFNADDVYLLSHNDAPRFKVVRTPLAHPQPSEHFEAVLPETPGVLKGFTLASDALYARELDGGVYHVMRVAPGAAAERVALPFEGDADIYPSDPRLAGITFTLTSWVRGARIEEFDPKSNQVNLTTIRPAGPFDNLDDLVSIEVEAPSYDGTMIPLSIMMKKGTPLDGSHPMILGGYGAYGMTEDPGFSNSRLAWLEHGGIDAVAHVRGGGERGEPWHLAGYKLTKPNTWRDMIACAEYLIDHHYTSSSHLGIVGGSAGGITIGRSLTERPDLFAAAAPMVGVLNPLRAEHSPNGPPNIPEFGSTTTQAGFEDLLAMDSLHHVREGVAYPAVMLTTGMNDPRVASWEPAKMTARLQAANSSAKPILLRIDYKGGHGIGASKQQQIEEIADLYSFYLWQFGDPDFQPPGH
jgi:prolyl oligopeptidase